MKDRKNYKDGKTFNWNGLPAISIWEGEKKYGVVFTNLNDEFTAVRIPLEEIDDEIHKIKAKEIGLFNCLETDMNKLSDEFTVVLSLTEKCNSQCRYCFLDAQNIGKDLTVDMLHAAIDYAISNAENRPITFAAFGGEPGIKEELLVEMVNYVKKKCIDNNELVIKFAITTNGVLNKNVVDILTQNDFRISLSMDGIREVQNYQRPLIGNKSSYDLVIQNLKLFLKQNLDVKIRATVTSFSVNKMVEAVRELSSFGVKKIHFEPVTPGGRGSTENELLQPPNSAVFVENLIKAIEIGAKVGVDVICFPYMNMLVAPIIFCDGRIKNRMVISPTGALSSCVEIQDINIPLFESLGLGYYDFETKKLVVTADERRPAIRGCESLRDEENTNCIECPLMFFCGGGCPTRNYRGTGMSNRVDLYRCEIIKGIMPYVLRKFYEVTFNVE